MLNPLKLRRLNASPLCCYDPLFRFPMSGKDMQIASYPQNGRTLRTLTTFEMLAARNN